MKYIKLFEEYEYPEKMSKKQEEFFDFLIEWINSFLPKTYGRFFEIQPKIVLNKQNSPFVDDWLYAIRIWGKYRFSKPFKKAEDRIVSFALIYFDAQVEGLEEGTSDFSYITNLIKDHLEEDFGLEKIDSQMHSIPIFKKWINDDRDKRTIAELLHDSRGALAGKKFNF